VSSSARKRNVEFCAMNGARKTRKSVPLSEAVAVNTREVNVAVEGLDPSAIAGSFAVHLLKDERRIASRFFFQASGGADAAQPGPPPQLAHFDFLLPIDVVADGKLTVEIEPAGSPLPGQRPQLEQMGHPTLSVYLMLESD
jgi:tyrosinase